MTPNTSVAELATRHNVPLEAAQGIYQAGLLAGEERVHVTSVKPRAKELRLTRDLYRMAVERGMNLSTYLETIDPSAEYRDGLDAFQRQLLVADIRVKGDLANGLPAHPVERFWNSAKPGTEVLFPEWVNRVYRGVMFGALRPDQVQSRFYQSSAPISEVLYPNFIEQQVRQKRIAPAVPLSAILAFTQTIDSAAYVSHYLTDDTDERTMKRVAEGAEVPTAILTGSDHTIRLKKYGRKLRATYESIRRTPIDRLALHLALLAVQAEADKVTTALDVIVNGDGNASTAATNYNLTALDAAAVPSTLTLKGYLAWRMKWKNPYNCDVVICQEEEALESLMLNLGSANVPFYMLAGTWGIGGFAPINPNLGTTGIGWIEMAALAHKMVGIDSRFGLEMVVEAGATLTETDRLISTQFNEIVMTESLGFAVFDQNANKTLDANA